MGWLVVDTAVGCLSLDDVVPYLKHCSELSLGWGGWLVVFFLTMTLAFFGRESLNRWLVFSYVLGNVLP